MATMSRDPNTKKPIDRIIDGCGWLICFSLLGGLVFGIALHLTRPTIRVFIGNTLVTLEVATTRSAQLKGLSRRTIRHLKKGGMFFPVNPPQIVSIWMKDVEAPLDVVFMRQGRVIQVLEQVPPCQANSPCVPIASPEKVDGVIEVLGGTTQKAGLTKGMRLDLPAGEKISPQ